MLKEKLEFGFSFDFKPTEVQQEMLDFINETLKRSNHVFILADRQKGVTELFIQMINSLVVGDKSLKILYVTPTMEMVHHVKKRFEPSLCAPEAKSFAPGWVMERYNTIKQKIREDSIEVKFTSAVSFLYDYKETYTNYDVVFQDCMFPLYPEGLKRDQVIIVGNTIENGNGMKVWVKDKWKNGCKESSKTQD